MKQILNATDAQNSLFSSFGLSAFNSSSAVSPVGNISLFSPLVDMSSTQALLNMVRTVNTNSVNQLESYMKGTISKRPSELVNNPLDLSSNSQPCNAKKLKRPSCSSSENSFSSDNSLPTLSSVQKSSKDRSHSKRSDSLSPKPRVTKSSFSSCSVSQTPPQIPGVAAASNHRASTTCLSLCTSSLDRTCPSRDSIENISHWTIDDVCNFVSSIDVCAEYADVSIYGYFETIAKCMLSVFLSLYK